MSVLSVAALFIGGLLTVQAAANLQLTKAVGTPYGAATLQLWVAAGLLGVDAGVVTGSLALLAGITVIVRGVRRAAVPAGRAPSPPVGTPVAVAPAWLLLGVVAGAALPVQGALNSRLRTGLEQPVAVALVSFLVAALTISVLLVALPVMRRADPPRWPSRAMPWWGWLGGLCAAAYVTGTFLLIPAIGAAVTVALTVTGQQLASAAVDERGLFRLPSRPLTGVRAGGLGLLIAGSLVVQLT